MKIQKTKGGFTLIELLVVITIIGILATGATATYTSQIQKARDTTRIGDLSAFKSAVEQLFQDASEYPEANNLKSSTATLDCTGTDSTKASLACLMKMDYIAKLPQYPKSGQPGNKSPLDYVYAVGPVSSVMRQAYEISSGFENSGNLTGKASKDSGSDDNRFEVGTGISKINTAITADNTSAATMVTVATPSTATAGIKISSNSCVALGTLAVSTSTQQSTPIVVKGDCSL